MEKSSAFRSRWKHGEYIFDISDICETLGVILNNFSWYPAKTLAVAGPSGLHHGDSINLLIHDVITVKFNGRIWLQYTHVQEIPFQGQKRVWDGYDTAETAIISSNETFV